MRPGELGQRRGVRVDDAAGEALEEAAPQQVHVPGADDQVDAVLDQPVGHRRVARLAVVEVVELEGGGRDPGRLRPLERARVGLVAGDRDDRQALVDQRLQVRALAADEDADHVEPSDHGARAGVGLRDDRAHPDPEVEDPPLLLLVDALLVEPRVDRRPLPRVPVELDADALRQHARQVAEDAAAGDVRERLHVGPLPQRAHVVEVEPVRREQQVGVEVVVADERAHEREAVGVEARGGEAEHDVAGLAALAVDQALAVDDPDAGAREVELLLAVDARQLGRLAADQRAAGLAADLRRALDQLGDLLELELVGGDVVEQEERLGAGGEHVVDAVGGQVAAGVAQAARPPREHELRADAVRGRGEEAPLVQRVEPREGAEPLGPGRLDRRAQPVDHRLRGGKRDPRRLVGPAPGAHGASLKGRLVGASAWGGPC